MAVESFADWLETPQGRYALAWEQAKTDLLAADIFGFNAVQIGFPQIDFLRANRMPFRFTCCETGECTTRADPHHLPFATNSVDLVVLPHILEFDMHPHQILREVDRVLVPGGQVVVSGFNTLSLWGARQLLGRVGGGWYLPQHGEFLAPRRVRDWLRLLSFEVTQGRFGCYRPALCSGRWLQRWGFMDAAGDRWWPVFGAVYFLAAIKRVPAMRLVGRVRLRAGSRATALRPVAQRAIVSSSPPHDHNHRP